MLTPEFLVLGHITCDLLPNGATAPGGTALYAATTAQRLGLRTAIFTAAAELPATLPEGVLVATTPSLATSTFENRYTPEGRQQWLHAAAVPLDLQTLPAQWRECPIVHLGPVLNECDLAMLEAFPNARVFATPQGWMREWDATLPTPIRYRPWQPDPALLRRLSGVVLSIEDVRGDERVAAGYARYCPLVVLTHGKEGATLFINGNPRHVAARPSRESDPTGAGDVFAAALLVRLHETSDPIAAAQFAATVAGISVEGQGASAIPTRAQLEV